MKLGFGHPLYGLQWFMAYFTQDRAHWKLLVDLAVHLTPMAPYATL
jgi:hypothetical protein